MNIYKTKIISVILIIIILCSFVNINVFARSNNTASTIPGNASATDADFIPSDAPKINAQSAIVMDIDTGDILFEKDAYSKRYPASITKILTCLLAVKYGNVNDELTISESVMSQVEDGSSSIGLAAGEKLTLRDALYGMMLNSGNECALAIAEHIGGSTEEFADMMNHTARELGCLSSNFVNPNGLQNDDHYTTAYDMALVGIAAYQYPEFKKLISSQSYEIPKTNKNDSRVLWQENRLIYEGNGEYYYEFCTGGKTGYTETALATLVSYAEKDGRRLITVVLKCDPTTDSYLDTIKLDEFCFNNYRLCKPLLTYDINDKNKNDILILDNYYNDLNHELLKYYVNQNYSFYVRSYIKDESILKRFTYYARPERGVAGKVEFVYDDDVIGYTDITTTIPSITATSTDALKEKEKPEDKDTRLIHYIWLIIKILIALIITALLIIIYIKVHKWRIMREAKRTIKYYPIKRDARRNKELQEKLEKEQAKLNREKKQKSDNKENTDSKEESNIKEDNNSDSTKESTELKSDSNENKDSIDNKDNTQTIDIKKKSSHTKNIKSKKDK